MFLQACDCPQRGGCLPQCVLGYHPPGADTPLGADTCPPKQTPPGSRPPQEQTPPLGADPLEQTPPRADTPSGADTPQSRHPTLGADTPPRSRHHTPLEQTPPSREQTPRPERRPLLRTVRILLECILVIEKFGPSYI